MDARRAIDEEMEVDAGQVAPIGVGKSRFKGKYLLRMGCLLACFATVYACSRGPVPDARGESKKWTRSYQLTDQVNDSVQTISTDDGRVVGVLFLDHDAFSTCLHVFREGFPSRLKRALRDLPEGRWEIRYYILRHHEPWALRHYGSEWELILKRLLALTDVDTMGYENQLRISGMLIKTGPPTVDIAAAQKAYSIVEIVATDESPARR